MIRTRGWTVGLEGNAHHKPPTCASCGALRKKQVVLQTSRRSGNVTTILRMQMPYCKPCAARVSGAGVRMMMLYAFVTAATIVLPCGAGLAATELGADALSLAIAGAGVAMLVSVFAALVLLPKMPKSPATARGEAATVTRYDESGKVDLFCTNAEFAQRLAITNRAPVVATTRYRFVELGAVAWSLALAIAMVVVFVEAPALADGKAPAAPKKEAAAASPDPTDAPPTPSSAPASSSSSNAAPKAPPQATGKNVKAPSAAPKPTSPAPSAAPKKAK